MDNKVLYGVIAVLVIAVVACVAYIAFDDGGSNNDGGDDTPDTPGETTNIVYPGETFDTRTGASISYHYDTGNGYALLTEAGQEYDDEIRLQISVNAGSSDLVTSITVYDQNNNRLESVSENGTVDGHASVYIVLDNAGATTLEVIPEVADSNGRLIGIETEDGLHVVYGNDVVTSMATDDMVYVEVTPDEDRCYAVLYEETSNGNQYHTRFYGSFTGDSTVSIPAKDGYLEGRIIVAYADGSGATPMYGLYIPDCTDSNHPSTKVTFYLNDQVASPGLHEIYDFSTLSVKVESEEPMALYSVSVNGSPYYYTPGWTKILRGQTSAESVLADEENPLNWLAGDLSVSVAVHYGTEYTDPVGSSQLVVNIESDELSVMYNNDTIEDGDSVLLTAGDIQVSYSGDEPMRVVYDSTWSGEDVSVWCAGESVLRYGTTTIGVYNMNYTSFVAGVLNISLEPA